jgi:MFS family permease
MPKTIISIAIGQTLVWSGLYYIFPAYLLHWESIHLWTRSEISLALTLAVISSAVCSPIIGTLIDKGAARWLISGSALIGAVLISIVPLVDNLYEFYFIWCLIGVTMSGCLYEPCFAFIMKYCGADAKKSVTAITLIAGFASTFCFFVSHWLVNVLELSANQSILFFAGSIGLVAAPLLYWGTATIQKSERNIQRGKLKTIPNDYSIIKNAVFVLLALSFSLIAFNHAMLLNHMIPLLKEYQFSATETLWVISLLGPMQVVGRMGWMLLQQSFNIRWMASICFVSMNIAALILLTIDVIPWVVFGFIVLQGAAFGVSSIIKPLITQDIMGDKQLGMIVGVMAVPYLTCFALAPYVGSLLWRTGGYQLMIYSIIIIGLIANLSLLWVFKMLRRNRAKNTDFIASNLKQKII